jgi:hypothetical protein
MLRLLNKPHDGGAKDGEFEMSLGMSGAVVGVGRMVGCGIARSQSLAVVCIADRYVVCQWSPHGDDLAPRCRRQRRLPGLFLLPYLRRTQYRIDCDSTGSTSSANVALARTSVAGDRRFAHQAIWAESRRGGCPSQPDSGPRRPALFVRSCLGNHLACFETSKLGTIGFAASGHVVRSPEDHGNHSQIAPLAAICHQTPVGSPLGGVGRSDTEKKQEKRSGSSSMAATPSDRF